MSEADQKAVWTTAITEIKPNRVAVRGYDIADLMGRSPSASRVSHPDRRIAHDAIGRLMDAILVASIDHGATPPSALAARTVASPGASLSASVAAGIMSINRHHGGAIEDAPGTWKRSPIAQGAEAVSHRRSRPRTVADIKAAGDRMPASGIAITPRIPAPPGCSSSPAKPALTARTCAARAVEKCVRRCQESAADQRRRRDRRDPRRFGLDPAAFNGIFMIARTPGLVAHVTEEQTREKPMRRIDPVNHATTDRRHAR